MKWKILIAVVLIIGAAAGYYFYNQKIVAESTKTYETAKVIRTDLIKTVSATGTVQPRDSVEVSGKVTARIQDILVEENDRVTAGQIVAILDGKDFEAKLDQANFTLTNARQKLERTQRLYNIGAKSLEELQDAQYEYDRAKSAVELAAEERYIATERYNAGEGILLDILDAEVALSTAKKNNVSARYDVARYSFDLAHAVGDTLKAIRE